MKAKMIVVGVLLASMAACGGSDGSSSSGSAGDEKYTQTWAKSYGETMCAEWLNEMTPGQRFAASADMLAGARNKGDGGTGLPDDELIDEFTGDVDTACDAGATNLAEAGAISYLNERSHYRP